MRCLNVTDAKDVQCLYTNSGMLGATVAYGKSNYYANYGSFQPNCSMDPVCCHIRAIYYFLYSLDPKNKFVGVKCDSLADAVRYNGECSDNTNLYGIYGKPSNGNYFFNTTGCASFAKK